MIKTGSKNNSVLCPGPILSVCVLAFVCLLSAGSVLAVDYHGKDDVGGSHKNGAGYATDDQYVNAGVVNATGGNGYGMGIDGGNGLYAGGGFYNRGTVTATGGNNNYDGHGNGIYVDSGGFINNSTVTATGGNNNNNNYGGYGIFVNSGGFINNSMLTATGGNNNNGGGNGIYVSHGGFTNNSMLTATGGNNNGGGYGIHVASGGFINSGTVTATGGTSSYGILLNGGDFINSGRVTATGGNSNSGNGIYVTNNDFINSGTVTATGGTSSYGILLNGGFINSNRLTLAAGGTAAAMHIDGYTGNDLTLKSGSTLALGGGFIDMHSSNNNKLAIESGARIASLSASGLAVGGSYDHLNFIRNISPSGNSGIFDLAQSSSATLQYSSSYSLNDSTYSLTVTRVALPSSFASGAGAGLLMDLENYFAGTTAITEGITPWAEVLSVADHQPTPARVKAAADRLIEEYTPQATATTLRLLGDMSRLTGGIMTDGLDDALVIASGDLDRIRDAVSSRSGRAYASLGYSRSPAYLLWATPLYQYSRIDGGDGWSTLKQNTGGGSVGLALVRNRFVFGLSGHYVYTDIDGGSTYDAFANGYGANVGVGYRFLGDGCNWNPRLTLAGGWTRYGLQQTRGATSVIAGESYSSRPDVDIFNFELRLSNPMRRGVWTLTPRLGVDFAHTRMDGYVGKASVVGTRALAVHKERDNSFRSVVGLAASYNVNNCLDLEAKADYYHEFGDRAAKLSSHDVSGVSIAFKSGGRDVGRDFGRIGAGVKYAVADRVHIRIGYDFHLAEHYSAHRATVSVGIGF